MIYDRQMAEKRTYFFRDALELQFFMKDGRITARSDLLSLDGYGDSTVEATDDLSENFDLQYRALVEDEDEDGLSPGALAIRKTLLDIVDRIEKHV